MKSKLDKIKNSNHLTQIIGTKFIEYVDNTINSKNENEIELLTNILTFFNEELINRYQMKIDMEISMNPNFAIENVDKVRGELSDLKQIFQEIINS